MTQRRNLFKSCFDDSYFALAILPPGPLLLHTHACSNKRTVFLKEHKDMNRNMVWLVCSSLPLFKTDTLNECVKEMLRCPIRRTPRADRALLSILAPTTQTNNPFHRWPLHHYDHITYTRTGHVHAQNAHVWNQHHPPNTNGPTASFLILTRADCYKSASTHTVYITVCSTSQHIFTINSSNHRACLYCLNKYKLNCWSIRNRMKQSSMFRAMLCWLNFFQFKQSNIHFSVALPTYEKHAWLDINCGNEQASSVMSYCTELMKKQCGFFSSTYRLHPKDHYIRSDCSPQKYTTVWQHTLGHRTNSSPAITRHSDRSLNHLHPEAGNKQIRLWKRYEVGACWWICGLSGVSCKCNILGVNQTRKCNPCPVSLV